MSFTYDSLVKIGAIKYFKADIIIEAARDLYYVSHIKKNLVEQRGIKDDKEATDGTVKIVTELIAQDYCSLATWGKEKGSFEELTITPEELHKLVDQHNTTKVSPFDYFLIATEKSKEWVARYEKLIDEL